MTADVYKALKSAGVEEQSATAAARGLADEPAPQARLKAAQWALEGELTEFRTELKAGVAEPGTDVERIEKRVTWRMVVICGIFSSIQTRVTVALIQVPA